MNDFTTNFFFKRLNIVQSICWSTAALQAMIKNKGIQGLCLISKVTSQD